MAHRNAVAFIECKTIGHAWEQHNPHDDGDLRGWDSRLTLRCDRCSSTRIDYIDYLGELGDRSYRKPDGYADAKDEKPSRAALRLMMVRR